MLNEVCTGPVSTTPCLCPVGPRKPEAQVEKGASDSGLGLESGPGGGNSGREVKMT